MYEFIVLGLIPGTHLQITFSFWIIGMVCLVIAGVVWLESRRHALRNWLVTISVAMVLRRIPARS